MAQQYFSRRTLSGPAYGAGALMPLASTGSILIHQTPETEMDEIWLYAANQGNATATLSLWWAQTVAGGVGPAAGGSFSGGGSKIEYSLVAASGLTLVIPGLILSPGIWLNGNASAAGSIVVYGFINHVGPSL